MHVWDVLLERNFLGKAKETALCVPQSVGSKTIVKPFTRLCMFVDKWMMVLQGLLTACRGHEKALSPHL